MRTRTRVAVRRAALLAAVKRHLGGVFTTDQVRQVIGAAGVAQGYLNEALHHLARAGHIERVCRGVYCLADLTRAGLHRAAMVLARPAAVSHASAAYHHGLLDAPPRDVTVMTTDRGKVPIVKHGASRRPGLTVAGVPFRFVRVPQARFFGMISSVVDNHRYQVTDLERTLLDGLVRPRYFGGMREVLGLFGLAAARLDPGKIARYARATDLAATKRLGYVLERLGVAHPCLALLERVRATRYRKLDPSGPEASRRDRRWKLVVNVDDRGFCRAP